jgi:hypothetical protein
MAKRKWQMLMLLIVIVLISGCATMGDVAVSRDSGTSAVYPVTADQAWEIAKAVFRWEGADAIEEHRKDGYMLTSSGMNMVSWGAVMGAWIDPLDQSRTKVTVVTKRRLSMNVATTLTESTFHNRFAQAVDIVKAGNPLPVKTP